MSQIGNKIKAGFFATPERQGEYIKKLLNYTGDVSVLDTTCGEGKILAQLAGNENFSITTYGVELEKSRAATAANNLENVFNAPIESMVISNDAFGMVFLNPPYDNTMRGYGDESTERKEFIELVRGTRYVAPGGVLIYIIPSYRFSDKKIARHLATNFTSWGIARFTDEDYPDYKQCVFIGTKKEAKTKLFDETQYNRLLNFADEQYIQSEVLTIEELGMTNRWDIPEVDPNISTFYSRIEDKSSFIEAISENKGFQAFIERTKPKTLEIGGRPIINIAEGQMALLLASGAVNGVLSEGDSLHAVQGMEVVTKVVSEEETEHSIVTKTRTKREVSVKVITPSGVVKKFM
ncbi:DUF6094 domain-containing protein [Viridibacillus arvi]|uniref:DUF6094 domain-containing protein n=1 Tax=Viridibacillus arvi TaxID=263475 RepID=UPI003D2E8335